MIPCSVFVLLLEQIIYFNYGQGKVNINSFFDLVVSVNNVFYYNCYRLYVLFTTDFDVSNDNFDVIFVH